MKKNVLLYALVFCFTTNMYTQTYVTDSIFNDGIYRDYVAYIPALYDGSEPVPLLLNLHGYSSNNFEQVYYSNFMPIADTANFIMVLPNGTYDSFGFRFWNCFVADGSGIDDVEFLSNLIDSISAVYNIDANRIYSTGMSNGGFMSYTLAGELSGRIAAIASVAGSIDKDRFAAIHPEHPTPVMEIHGTVDGVVPYDGSTEFTAIDSVLNFWVENNNCNPVPEFTAVENTSTIDGCTAEHYIYSGGDNNANVEHFKIVDGGHTWPGTIFTFLGVTNLDISASKEIWNFLNRYSLDILTANEQVIQQQHSIKIFPNPCVNMLTVSFPADEITAYDLTGRQVAQEQASTTLNTSAWQAGMYLVRVRTGEKFFLQLVQKIPE